MSLTIWVETVSVSLHSNLVAIFATALRWQLCIAQISRDNPLSTKRTLDPPIAGLNAQWAWDIPAKYMPCPGQKPWLPKVWTEGTNLLTSTPWWTVSIHDKFQEPRKGGYWKGFLHKIYASLGCGALSAKCTAGPNILDYFLFPWAWQLDSADTPFAKAPFSRRRRNDKNSLRQ